MVRLGLFYLVILFGSLLSAQPAASEADLPPRNASVTVTVIDVTTQEPLAKALIRLSGDGPGSTASFRRRSDDQGKFVFEDVPPGRYRLSVELNGYVPAENVRARLRVEVRPGAVIDDLVLGMQPAAAVSGAVFDEDGDPFHGLLVEAVRTVYRDGYQTIQVVNFGRTDDRGHYRLYGLSPGGYYLRAKTDRGTVDDLAAVYGMTYYPNGDDDSQASLLQLSGQAEMTGVDFRMSRSKLLRISGQAIDGATGQAISAGHFSLLDRTRPGRQQELRRGYVSLEGRFGHVGLRPGSYRVEVMSYDRESPSNAVHDFELTDQPIEDMLITAQPTFPVPGRVAIEGDWDFEALPMPPRFTLVPDGAFNYPGPDSPLLDGGRVTFERVWPRAYRIQADSLGDLYLKRARYKGQDALSAPLVFEEDGGEIEILLSANSARIAGQMVRDGEGLWGVEVVLVPDDRQRTHLFRHATTDRNGAFGLSGIAPGRYKVFAWEQIQMTAWLDPNVLAPFEGRGVSIELEEGDSEQVDPKLIEARE